MNALMAKHRHAMPKRRVLTPTEVTYVFAVAVDMEATANIVSVMQRKQRSQLNI